MEKYIINKYSEEIIMENESILMKKIFSCIILLDYMVKLLLETEEFQSYLKDLNKELTENKQEKKEPISAPIEPIAYYS